jgi:hypothetical protein
MRQFINFLIVVVLIGAGAFGWWQQSIVAGIAWAAIMVLIAILAISVEGFTKEYFGKKFWEKQKPPKDMLQTLDEMIAKCGDK